MAISDEDRSEFAAWERLHMSEKFSSETKTLKKQKPLSNKGSLECQSYYDTGIRVS